MNVLTIQKDRVYIVFMAEREPQTQVTQRRWRVMDKLSVIYYSILFGFWEVNQNFRWWLFCMSISSYTSRNRLIAHLWEKLSNYD